MDFEFYIQSQFDPFDLNKEYEATKKIVRADESCNKLIDDIMYKINHIQANGFNPKFIVMNTRNYERIIGYMAKSSNHGAPDELFGYQIVVWDVPVDYVNVRCSARDEWAYGEAIRKGARK